MKAVVFHRYGPPGEVLELMEVEEPVPGEGEVLVQVRAAAAQAGDYVMARGVPYFMRPAYGLTRPKNPLAGFDMAGVVEAVGEGVEGFRPDEEVFGWCTGAFAEYAVAPAEQLVGLPTGVGFERAAATVGSAITALQAVRDHGGVQAGHQVLVVGASGGVGTFAVQLARHLGAEVTGVCSTRNVDLVREIGAAHVIDYTREELTARGQRYDLILDIAGNRPISLLRSALAPEGTLILVGGRGGPWTMGMGRTLGAMLLNPFVGQRLVFFVSAGNHQDLTTLRDLLEAGEVGPVIDRTYPLEQTPQAIAYVDEGHARGKVVVTTE